MPDGSRPSSAPDPAAPVPAVRTKGLTRSFGPLTAADHLDLDLPAAAIFATFSLAVACLVKTRERFMGTGQVLTMPLFFASNAIYPWGPCPGGCGPWPGSIPSPTRWTPCAP
jgi:hypothetical protein